MGDVLDLELDSFIASGANATDGQSDADFDRQHGRYSGRRRKEKREKRYGGQGKSEAGISPYKSARKARANGRNDQHQ